MEHLVPTYEGQRDKEDLACDLFKRHLALLGDVFLGEEQKKSLCGIVIREHGDRLNEDSVEPVFVAEFDYGCPKRQKLFPPGFYFTEDCSAESVIRNLWDFVWDRKVGIRNDVKVPSVEVRLTALTAGAAEPTIDTTLGAFEDGKFLIAGNPEKFWKYLDAQSRVPRADNNNQKYHADIMPAFRGASANDAYRKMQKGTQDTERAGHVLEPVSGTLEGKFRRVKEFGKVALFSPAELWQMCRPEEGSAAGEMARRILEAVHGGLAYQWPDAEEAIRHSLYQQFQYVKAVRDIARSEKVIRPTVIKTRFDEQVSLCGLYRLWDRDDIAIRIMANILNDVKEKKMPLESTSTRFTKTVSGFGLPSNGLPRTNGVFYQLKNPEF